MASQTETNIYLLNRAIDILQKGSLQELNPSDQQDLTAVYKLFLKYGDQPITEYAPDPRIVDLESFFEIKPYKELTEIKKYFATPTSSPATPKKKTEPEVQEEPDDVGVEEEEDEKAKKAVKPQVPVKESTAIPAELESLVASYKEAQADKIEADTTHSVADAIKRARKTWDRKNRIETILKNRTDAQKEYDERYYINTVNPKEDNRIKIERNIRKYAEEAVIAKAQNLGIDINKLSKSQISNAIEDLTYLGLSGAVDLTNYHELNIVSQLALKNQGVDINNPITAVYTTVSSWQEEITKHPYSDKPDEIEKEFNIADEKAQEYLKVHKEVEEFTNRLKTNNIDFEDLHAVAGKDLQNIQIKIISVVPYSPKAPEPTPLSVHGAEFENLIRKTSPNTLRINPEVVGAQASGMLLGSGGQTRNISPEAVRLSSLGLNSQNLESLKSNPAIQKFLNEHQDLQKQIEFQLKKIADSKLGQEIQSSIKPITTAAETFNKLSPAAQNAAKMVLDPVGTVKSWASTQAGKRIGGFLVEQSGSLAVQKFGNFLLSQGLSGGVKAFTTETVKAGIVKVATWAAVKLGVSVTAESLNAVAPGLGIAVDIAAQIVLWLGEKTIGAVYRGAQNLAVNIWGEELKAQDLMAPVAALGGMAATAAAVGFAKITIFRNATVVAAASAAGVIASAIIITALYTLFAYLVAPVLSTLVQLDSQEKVKYNPPEVLVSSGDCGWPTAGHYSINTGPRGGTHRKSQLEAIDIGAPNASAHLSGTDGVVTFTGVYSNYGNTVKIQAKTSAGSFTAIYGHLSSISVGVGQQVKKGQQIGLVGGSGGWSPHIHMEYQGIRYNECPAGGLKIKEECCSYSPAPLCSGPCNAFSN